MEWIHFPRIRTFVEKRFYGLFSKKKRRNLGVFLSLNRFQEENTVLAVISLPIGQPTALDPYQDITGWLKRFSRITAREQVSLQKNLSRKISPEKSLDFLSRKSVLRPALHVLDTKKKPGANPVRNSCISGTLSIVLSRALSNSISPSCLGQRFALIWCTPPALWWCFVFQAYNGQREIKLEASEKTNYFGVQTQPSRGYESILLRATWWAAAVWALRVLPVYGAQFYNASSPEPMSQRRSPSIPCAMEELSKEKLTATVMWSWIVCEQSSKPVVFMNTTTSYSYDSGECRFGYRHVLQNPFCGESSLCAGRVR